MNWILLAAWTLAIVSGIKIAHLVFICKESTGVKAADLAYSMWCILLAFKLFQY